MKRCLMCGHPEGNHTNGAKFCDYNMVPGDIPEVWTPEWTDANPYKDGLNPELAKDWEREYTRNRVQLGTL